jgi:hypothetical protein
MKDTSGFYKFIEEENIWWYAQNFVYHKDYELQRDGNRASIDGWEWHDAAPIEYIIWERTNNLAL